MKSKDIPTILGGTPLFEKPYHLVRPLLPPLPEILEGLEELNETRMFTNQGRFAVELERRIASMINVKHCALFCNATIAIICLTRCLGLKGEVIVPSFTFAATAHALVWNGLMPKFVDIDSESLMLDPKKVREAMSNRVSAIMPVNIFGRCCDHEELLAIARADNVPLIYDSAQAFGTRYKGKLVGSLGDAEVFSFHATKLFHTGEGGAVVTNDTDLYEHLCRMRNFGFKGYLNCVELGMNGKLDELSALFGLKLLDRLPSQIANRQWVFQHYRESLKKIKGVVIPNGKKSTETNYSHFYVIIEPEKFGLTNLELNYALMSENIVTRCYFYPPVHRTVYYTELLSGNIPDLPVTDRASLHVLCLPVYGDMRVDELAKIVEGIQRCQNFAMEIKEKVAPCIPRNWESMQTFEKHVSDRRAAAGLNALRSRA